MVFTHLSKLVKWLLNKDSIRHFMPSLFSQITCKVTIIIYPTLLAPITTTTTIILKMKKLKAKQAK
jgi:hypothetical protein